MPRYRVTEKRSYTETVIIDATDEDSARHYGGVIIAEWNDADGGSVGEELLSCEQIGDEDEE